METPCSKCFTIEIREPCQAWLNAMDVQKENPDVIITGETFVSSSSAFDFYEAACAHYNGEWTQCVEPLTCWSCWVQDINYHSFVVDNMGPDVNFCNYTYNVSFATVTLVPGSPWDGGTFTMNIASADPRIIITPSSVEITNGFNEPIVLTLTLNPAFPNPQSLMTLSDMEGNCSFPTPEELGFETTPILSC